MKIIKYCDSFCQKCTNFEECNICENKYILNDKKCVQKCNSNCEDCDNFSSDNNNQKCTLCNDKMLLQVDKGNCVEKCSDKYFQKENTCLNCHKNCKTCSNINEIYQNGTENENCLSCDKDSSYPYLINSKNFPKNCVSKCPEGTKLNELNNFCEEIIKEKIIKENKENSNIIFIILIVFLFAIILIFSIFLIIRYYRQKKAKENFNIENLGQCFEIQEIARGKD